MLPTGRKRLRTQTATERDVRNLALAVVLQWGPEWAAPKIPRLQAAVAGLTEAAAAAALLEAERVRKLADDVIARGFTQTSAGVSFPELAQVRAVIDPVHPWVDEDNWSHLYSQACYYALR